MKDEILPDSLKTKQSFKIVVRQFSGVYSVSYVCVYVPVSR